MAYSVYDRDLQRLALIDSFRQAEWSENYVGLGSFVMTVSETPENVKSLQVGNFVKRDDSNNVMIIMTVLHDDNHNLTVVGNSALHLLTRRIIDSTMVVSNAEQAMRYAVANFRPFNNMILGEYKGYTEMFDPTFETTYQTVYDLCTQICDETGLGMRMLINTREKKLIFDVYKGDTDINSIYSDIWGNLLGSKLNKSDIEYSNIAYVAGEGTGGDRIIVEVGEVDSTEFDRFELFIDARDLQQKENETLQDYKNRLIARGKEKLSQHPKIFEVTIDIPFSDYDKKFSLGDYIKVNIERYNLKLDIRVQGYKIKQAGNLESIELSLGIPIIRR